MLRGLPTQILLWIVVPLAFALLGLAYVGVNSHQATMREMVAERDGALARAAALHLNELLTDRAYRLRTTDPAHPSTWDLRAFDSIALLDAQGRILTALPSAETWRTRAEHAPRAGTWSAPFAEDGQLRVLVAAPTDPGGVSPGSRVLVGAVTLPPLESYTRQMQNGHTSSAVAYIVDRNGIIIAHPDPARLGINMSGHAGIAQVIRGETGATFHHDAAGAELVVGYAPIEPAGWGLLIEEPWADVVAPMFQYSVLLPIMLALVAVVALGAISFGMGRIVRPVARLAQMANRIAYGDYRAAGQPVGGVREIEELRETVNRMALQLEAARAAMQDYIAAMTRGQEEERKRLARELHDDTIQSLIALQQRVELADKALRKDPAAVAPKLAELQALVASALVSVRAYIRDLRPTYLEELGLIPALEVLTHEARATFSTEGEEQRLDPERELALYRIVQAALNNVAQHAQATRVTVTLTYAPAEVRVTIVDNGVGFAGREAPADFAREGHFGLMGMQERAQLFGGALFIQSAPGQGTTVVAYLPVAVHDEPSG